jgi:hypothetical protein
MGRVDIRVTDDGPMVTDEGPMATSTRDRWTAARTPGIDVAHQVGGGAPGDQ